ncbi:hypothetical protein [Fibrella aquatica]|uniref:hypothetical protein n=1 Tax=Fibrella aquatica TaxID=3242487 RepID=UPI003520B928
MEEWPDDHLDELFRKSAEDANVPFNTDDWADMSRRLDEHDRQTLFDRISRWGGIGALLLLMLAGLAWVTYDERASEVRQEAFVTLSGPARKTSARLPETRSVSKINSRLQEAETTNPKDEKSLTDNEVLSDRKITENQLTVLSERPSVQQSAQRVRIPAGQETTKTVKKGKDQPANRLADNTSPDPERRSVTETAVKVPSRSVVENAQQQADNPARAEQAVSRNQPDQVISVTEPVGAEGYKEGVTPWLPNLMSVISLSALVEQVNPMPEPMMPEITSPAPGRRATPRLSGLSVMVFASPDLSSIGLENFERPGSNAGLVIQYQITDRLSVNTGAMLSTKRYQTYFENYVWPRNWKLEVWPDDISGVCKMIDVPLNLRYDWSVRPRGDGRAPARWFASAGLTSYFIQHEVYNYEYANPADPKIKVWSWDNQKAGRPGGSFGFSNLNMSAGYEQPITQRLSWQVEPFVKVPLKQVGYFKVKLLSTGAFVGLRYRL